MMTADIADRTRSRFRVAAAGLCILAAVASGGGKLLTADTSPVRLLGVTTDGSAVVIEATEPVAYAVSKPDPLTLHIDLRNVTVENAANQVERKGAIAGVTLEQANAVDGRAVARVRLALARPASHTVRSARNTIRVELSAAPAAAAAPPRQRPQPRRPRRTAAAPARPRSSIASSPRRAGRRRP